MKDDEVRRQVYWTPETPIKPRQEVLDDGGCAVRLNFDLLDDQDRVLEKGSFPTPVESNVVPLPQGEASNILPQYGEAPNFHPQCDDANIKHGDELINSSISPSPSKKKQKVSLNKLKGKHKKKVYRPKIVFDETQKKTKRRTTIKSKVKTKIKTPNNTTPLKFSIPKKKRSDTRRVPSCKLSLLSFLNRFHEGKPYFPFTIGNAKVDERQGGFENSIFKNLLGNQYNALQNYEALTSLSSSCLIQSRQVGANFPIMCKRRRKRVERRRLRLEKFLTPFKKGRRSKSFTRKKRSLPSFTMEGNTITRKAMKSLIMKIRSLKKKKKGGKTKYNNNGLVVYKGPNNKDLKVEVALDKDTLKEWNLIMSGKKHEDEDSSGEDNQRHWDEERSKYHCRVQLFMSYMHVVQGNRTFSPWKGSVLDSIVGAYLTQNVSDHYSSSAYMSLAAKFPLKTNSFELCIEDQGNYERHESVAATSSSIFNEIELVKDIEDAKVGETVKVQKAKELKGSSSLVDNKEGKVRILQEVDKETQERWDSLRKMYMKMSRHSNHADSVDWEAVRCAQVSEIAESIAIRGQHNMLARRIKGLLSELKDTYGSLDLEWLRYIPPMEAKEYLLNIYGMGLKSVECIRLLTLQNQAFPVDVNVGRIAVRLGWVPLQPLPEETQIHNLEKYPPFDNIQKYLWPRLCTLDPGTLYQLHYHLITFGKVFCTKKNPNCNACPMKGECTHFASACASANIAPSSRTLMDNTFSSSISEVNKSSVTEHVECEPIIEMPLSPKPESCEEEEYVDHHRTYNHDDSEEILTINLRSHQESLPETQNDCLEKLKDDNNMSTLSLVALPNNVDAPKMKNVGRLRTERLVYVLSDGHPLLAKYISRDPDDPYPYLLAIWTAGELESSNESSKNTTQEEEDVLTVLGTLLIPCRTAMRGRFPLNGTYFQVNEVFADFDSMINPINVPRKWIWNLEKRIVYFGTGTSSIMRGLSAEQIHNCFWKGFVCVRAIDMKTGAPRPLSYKFHRNTTAQVGKGNKNASPKE